MKRTLIFAAFAVAACDPAGQSVNNLLGNAAADTAPAASTEAAEAPAPRNWRYQERSDPMTDRATRLACVTSRNEAMLDFPYHPTRAELCLRDSPQHGRDAYVALLGDGQILCPSYRDCTVQVRFDREPMRPYSAVGASDNSSNIVFIRNRDRLERELRNADVTAVQIEFYRAGQQALIFDTAGFEWPAREGQRKGS